MTKKKINIGSIISYVAIVFVGFPLVLTSFKSIESLRSEMAVLLSISLITWTVWTIHEYVSTSGTQKKEPFFSAYTALTLLIRALLILSSLPFLDWFVMRGSPVSSSGALVSSVFVFVFWMINRGRSLNNAPTAKQNNKTLTQEQMEILNLKSSISVLEEELQSLQKQNEMANKTIFDLQSKDTQTQPHRDSDAKFSMVKRAFARKYHPNNMQSDGIDKLVREEIFREFWEEIRKIEDDD